MSLDFWSSLKDQTREEALEFMDRFGERAKLLHRVIGDILDRKPNLELLRGDKYWRLRHLEEILKERVEIERVFKTRHVKEQWISIPHYSLKDWGRQTILGNGEVLGDYGTHEWSFRVAIRETKTKRLRGQYRTPKPDYSEQGEEIIFAPTGMRWLAPKMVQIRGYFPEVSRLLLVIPEQKMYGLWDGMIPPIWKVSNEEFDDYNYPFFLFTKGNGILENQGRLLNGMDVKVKNKFLYVPNLEFPIYLREGLHLGIRIIDGWVKQRTGDGENLWDLNEKDRARVDYVRVIIPEELPEDVWDMIFQFLKIYY